MSYAPPVKRFEPQLLTFAVSAVAGKNDISLLLIKRTAFTVQLTA